MIAGMLLLLVFGAGNFVYAEKYSVSGSWGLNDTESVWTVDGFYRPSRVGLGVSVDNLKYHRNGIGLGTAVNGTFLLGYWSPPPKKAFFGKHVYGGFGPSVIRWRGTSVGGNGKIAFGLDYATSQTGNVQLIGEAVLGGMWLDVHEPPSGSIALKAGLRFWF
ncbi:MAG: hypothetical protein A3I89_00145 [Candidatus Harrisonbacteria bacterium RIFCSPLOWO2_02_FULL_41_11]|uniref:Uncharacterized protein n=1 Tax=Candidatus Harrisonbacteria bacterium RIFCSPHIGHO2_02_FULL_42_16 TaxID=1798404 RepID=A0A1G1ZI68_9BACT|nr:MAG: hypothetical protein A3B92_03240 [Candidatus Harrisonbacteria bacterium RIFCSPHIGHO2_02_FULL_42_16]OGY65769.1 MAG: hypothetical protein A3I89_00145 [Candidatus Harrisonbacteria bacterium RIFCSPLOWO2_02_FULL_41_11]